jgi:hypothetical protein
VAWFNADDKMHSHPKMRQAGLEAIGLWTLAGTYCTDYLTDGAVPAWFVESWPRGKQLAQKLVKADLWESTEDGWQFLSWAEYQRTKEQVLAAKEKAAERKAKFLENQGKNK